MANKVLDTQPPTISTTNVTSSSKWDNVFVKNKDGDTVSLDEKADEIAGEVSKASPVDLLQMILNELRAQSYMMAQAFGLKDDPTSYRQIEPFD